MTTILIIGDVHARVEDLEDCEHLINVIKDVESREAPKYEVFLGDLFDAFALKNVVVERWWMEALDRLSAPGGKYLLLGNHDRPGDSSAIGHALQAHGGQAHIVDYPTIIAGPDILLLPFYFKAEDFVQACVDNPQYKTVLCHQSAIGGKYETGLAIEARHDASAFDPAAIPQKCVIGGHIHTPQQAGKVLYLGSPRWRNNVSDCLPNGNERYIYAVDFEGGLPKAIRKYPTGNVCKRIWKVDDVEGGKVQQGLPGKEGDRYVVDITGSAAYIEQAKKVWSQPGVRIRSFQTDRPGPKLSEAQGVAAAWAKWATEYKPRFGTSSDSLEKMARERLAL